MHRIGRLFLYVGLVLTSVFFLFPVLWMLLMAIRPTDITATEPLRFIFMPDFGPFVYLMTEGGGGTSLVASSVQAGLATLIALPIAIMTCYGLTRWRYRGRTFLGQWYFTLMLAPPVIFVIPLFIMLGQIGVIGTNWAAVIAFQTFSIPLAVLLLKSFFEELPVEIEEAAMIDGCSRSRILVQIFLPVLRPGLLVAGIFVFCFGWNNLLFVQPLTSGDNVPLTVRALSFYATSGVNWTYIGATAVVSMIVPMVLFFIFRKHIVSGLTFGAVK
ncbi:MAG: carbohydrate ABC transporter permease [Beutenbergiaceae bacterium]